LLDYMYKGYMGADEALPTVYVPDDPASHIIACVQEARRALSPHGAIMLFSDHKSDPELDLLQTLRDCGLRRADQYIWNKPSGVFSSQSGAVFASSHEVVDVYRRSDIATFPPHLRYEPSVSPKWHCRSHRTSSERGLHPFEKPVELMKALISVITVNGLVIDPFAGSGSSGIAAVQLGCSYRGAELVQEYVDLANRRITLTADREQETVEAINAALAGANPEQQAAIRLHLEQAGIQLTEITKEAA